MRNFQKVYWIHRAIKSMAFCAIAAAITSSGITRSLASDACTGTVCIEQAWARASPPGAQNAAIYFSIVNNTADDEMLTAVSTTAAAQAMVHQSTLKNRVVQMQMVEKLPIPAHGRVLLSPIGYHVMLTELKVPLKEGQLVPLKLSLASGRTLEVEVPVLKVSAMGPARSDLPVPGVSAHVHH